MFLHQEKYWHHISVKIFVIIVGLSHMGLWWFVFSYTTALNQIFTKFWVVLERFFIVSKI